MTQKTQIAATLNESALLLPDMVDAALEANARIKFLFTWLQTACAFARAPAGPVPNLYRDQMAAGAAALELPPLEQVRQLDEGYEIAGVGNILEQINQDLDTMIAPLVSSGEADEFRARQQDLAPVLTATGTDRIPLNRVDHITRARDDGGDSVHRLVMDVHKALNRLQGSLAQESVDGAQVYRIAPEDKDRIRAFMRGLNRTAPLKFDHPGLGTTATRDGTRLTIQNDLGTTDAHVVILHVEGARLSITYTDVHGARLRFFKRRLGTFPVEWADTRSRHEGALVESDFHQTGGVLQAEDEVQLDACLERLGESLVFLIDWNRARKRLRKFVPKAVAVELLDWAAEERLGHRGFLSLGGEKLIWDLLNSVRSGGATEGLSSLLGEQEAREFLMVVLAATSQGLMAGRPERIVFEELRADLLLRMDGAGDRHLEHALDHAAMTLDLGRLALQMLMSESAESMRVRASRWERDADAILQRLRGLRGADEGYQYRWDDIVAIADDAADCFEDAMFQLGLWDMGMPPEVREPMLRLAEQAVAAAQDYIRVLSASRYMHRGAARDDVREFLEGLEQLRGAEHASDAAEREVIAALMATPPDDARMLMVASSAAHEFETAADALLHAGLRVGDRAMQRELIR